MNLKVYLVFECILFDRFFHEFIISVKEDQFTFLLIFNPYCDRVIILTNNDHFKLNLVTLS